MAGEADIWQPRTVVEVTADTKTVTERFTALQAQQLFVLNDFAYAVGTGALQVYKNGAYLTPTVDFIEQTDTTFTVVVPCNEGDQVVAVGNVGISGAVSVRDTDIFLTNYQNLRDYTGIEDNIYVQGNTTKGDGGAGFFQLQTGAAPGTYVDDDLRIVVPTGGDGSSAWIRSNNKTRFATIAQAQAYTVAGALAIDDTIYIEERGAYFKCVAYSAPTGFSTISGDGSTKMFQLVLDEVPATTQFGVKHDQLTDNTSAFADMMSYLPVGWSLQWGHGTAVGDLVIEKPISIIGHANSAIPAVSGSTITDGSALKAVVGGNPYALTIRKAAVSPVKNWENQMYGVSIKNLTLDGDNRTLAKGGMYLANLDHCRFENMEIQRFQREAINFYEEIRECDFTSVRTRWCGTKTASPATSYPALRIVENGTVDAHNALRFSNCQVIFSMGDSVEYDDNASAPNAVRQIFWNNCFFHGVLASQDGGLFGAFTAYNKLCRHHNIKGAEDVYFNNTDLHQSGDGVPAINMEDSVNGVSPQVFFNNGRMDSHYGATAPQYGVHVQTGEFSVSMTKFRNHISGVVRAESGATVHYGMGNVLDTGAVVPSYHTSAIVTQNLFSDVNFNNRILSAIGEAQARILTSRNTAESILIQSQIDNSATAMNFQTKNGSGTQSTKMIISSGAAGQVEMVKPVKHTEFTNANRPAANFYKPGTEIWNTDDNEINVTNGTNWYAPVMAIT